MVGRPRSVSDEAVFDAVSAVVADVGPAGLTLSAVAERAGLSAPALAQRFGSKRKLLLAYAAAAAHGVDDLFEQVRERSPDPLSTLRAVLVTFAAPVATRSALANNLAFLYLDLTDPELGALAAEQSRLLRRRLRELLDEAQAAGHLVEVDPAALADTLYTIYNGALVTWAIDGRGSLARWLAERLDRVLAPHISAGGSGGPIRSAQ
jgi:AcrR family transcriptional regulator